MARGRYPTDMSRTPFVNEFCKIAASKDQFDIPQTRSGRRSMTVDTLLRKEKEGTLYKKLGAAVGVEMVNGKKRVLSEEESAKQLSDISSSLSEIPGGVLGGLRKLLSADVIPGGLADDKDPGDFDPEALAKGIKVEMEHTDDEDVAREIAMDHLSEHPGYYTALEDMEKSLEKDGFDKVAITRAVKEWRVAKARGDTGMMSELEGAYGKLELNPRHLRDLGRGEEAVAMQMLGGQTPQGVKVPAGTMVQKLYDPNSVITRGSLTGRVVADKQRITDAVNAAAVARGDAAPMAAMYGHAQLAPGRHTSYHEYVPHEQLGRGDTSLIHSIDAKLRRGEADLSAAGLGGKKIEDAVGRGMFGGMAINPGNVVKVKNPDGTSAAKVIDFLPAGKGYGGGDPRFEAQADPALAEALKQRLRGVEPANAQDVKKNFFAGVQHGAPAAGAPAAGGGGVLSNPWARGAAIAGGAALLAGGGYLAYRHYKNKQQQAAQQQAAQATEQKVAAAWAKLADSWKPQWLEMAYTEGERGMQNVPVKGKKARGDVPSLDEGLVNGQRATPAAEYRQPTDSALPMKTAMLAGGARLEAIRTWAKHAAVMGKQVKSPTNTVPDVDGPQNRMQHQLDKNYFIGPSSDAQPLTGSSSDAYQRA